MKKVLMVAKFGDRNIRSVNYIKQVQATKIRARQE
jgi:hypothetical protein